MPKCILENLVLPIYIYMYFYFYFFIPQKDISDILLTGMNNVQSALLNGKEMNEGPVIISSAHISLYVNR